MTDETFGKRLRAARKRAGFNTIKAFADALSKRGHAFSDDAIGHWENDRRSPYRSEADRPLMLSIFSLLAEHGGVDSTRPMDEMLLALDHRPLNAEEKARHFHQLASVIDNLQEKPPYHRLVGREEAISAIIGALTTNHVVVISGLGGIGKTALAYEVVKTIMQDNKFDKLAWETAKSEEFSGTQIRVRSSQTVSFPVLLASYARQLSFGELATQPLDRLRNALKNAFQMGKYLIVLDNLETLEAAQDAARDLFQMVNASQSRILITSRERLAHESFVHDYFIRGLSEPASIELLHDEADTRGAAAIQQADESLLKRIYKITEGMPLALKLIVSQSLLGIAVDEELERLHGVVDEEELYRFIYLAIWLKLSKPAQQLLVGTATFATSALRSMLQPVSELDNSTFNQAVPELVKASLMEVSYHALTAQQRYDIHAMTRWFVNGPLTEMWNRQQGLS
jgi:nucleoside-triphosphatase THEP1